MRIRTSLGILCCLAVGCGSDEAAETLVAAPVDQAAGSPVEDLPVALTDGGGVVLDDPSFPDPLVERTEIINGGPGPDGIPPIDEPTFLPASDTTGLNDREPIISLSIDGETRGYPISVLIWHEIVNDTVAGTPVSVTYCPLCNSAFAFDRRLDARTLDFGTSGKLYNSSLVMYDRQTRSLWTHFNGQAVGGVLTGSRLDTIPVQMVAWDAFRDDNPEALVLSSDTGFDRDYGANPYPGYDDVDDSPFLFNGPLDDRLAAKERVVGIEHNGAAAAVTLSMLMANGVAELTVGDDDLWVLWEPGVSSALEGSQVSDGRDVGSTAVYLAPAATPDGPNTPDPATVDRATLTAITHVDTFWFAWAAFQPETTLVAE